MNKLTLVAALLSATLITAHANAAKYLFKMTGSVSYIAHSQDLAGGGSEALPVSTAIRLGDKASVVAIYDTEKFTVGSLYNADPRINIYNGSFSSLSYQLGDYNYDGLNTYASFQFWDGYPVNTVAQAVDSWSTSGFLFTGPAPLPVDLGTGSTSLHFSFNAFDFAGAVRNSDSITENVNLNDFGSRSGSVGFYNSTLGRHSTYLLDNLTVSLSSVGLVPEPATWSMMLAGFGMVGGLMRYRRRARSVIV